ncbi:Bacterial type II/III secretion system short domain protein [Symmachiella macrocystis]|uniref:Bacterial type II/III secretion system short domain protein n=1 Tax=Symmachiella macrocystis TaxID=2527985 RepID=A0A5C6BCT1_9PLAN|nr:secretin N-terminal domain-containing protein [Symmachiella macrocystis]TWU09106.1 Bacterial type II/III secretion system short domain protein [Symmachiella macrocystis]
MTLHQNCSPCRRHLFRTSLLAALCGICPSLAIAQDAPPAADTPAAKAPPAAAKPAAAKLDYARLADPEVAAQLNLTEEQQTKLQELLKKRSEALSQAEAADKAKIAAEQNGTIAALLSEEQRAKLAKIRPVPKLRFNFRFQRWAEVLQWFAQEADLSLVMDAPPPATFNYTDTKEYTPTEAIDLLNGVLLTKDFTLIRRGRMLIVIDMKEGIPQDLIPRIDLKDLEDRGKHEFVSVMFPLGKKNAEEVDAEIMPLLGNQGKSVPLPKTQQILVTATAGNMRAIGAVIDSIPEPAPPKQPPKPTPPEKPELRTYATKSADAAAAVELINQLISGIKVVPDAKAGQINVFATPSQQTAVLALLDKIQTDNPPESKPRLEVYSLTRGDHTQLLESLRLVLPEMQMRIDPVDNRLIAWGTPDEQAKIKASLDQLGGDGPNGKTAQLATYLLLKADPASTQELLSKLVPNARVSFDPQTRNLIVVAVPDDQRVVKAMLDQLQPTQPGANSPELQFYPFKVNIPTGLMEVLQTLVPNANIRADGKKLIITATPADHVLIADTIKKFPMPIASEKPRLEIYPITPAQRKRFEAVIGTITGDLPGIRIITDAEPGELAVWAKSKEHEALQAILEKLKRDVPDEEKFTLTSYPVKAAQQPQTTSVLQTLYPELRVIPDAEGNRLLVWAGPQRHTDLKATLDKVLAEVPEADQPRFEAYAIQGADATSLMPTLQTLLPAMRLSVDPKTTRLIAWGTPKEHQMLKSALTKVGGGMAEMSPQIEVYRLTKADPSATQTLLQGLFPAARLTIDPQTRSLIAVAIPEDQQGIRATLEQLQPETPGPNERTLQFIPLEEAPPASLLAVLQQLAPQSQVSYDLEAKRLMVVATAADHNVINESVKRVVDSAAPAEKFSLEIYPVTAAQRTRFQTILDTVQSEMPGMRIITDAEPGELAVWAKKSQHEKLADIIAKLRRDTPAGDKFVLVPYQIKNADAANTLTVMQSIFPNIKIVLDAKTKKLLIWAPPSEHEKIQDVVDKIDSGAAADVQESYKVYPVPDSDAAAVINLLQQQLPDVTFTNDTTSKAIIAWGRKADHQKVDAILKQVLASLDPDRKPKLVIYPVGKSDSANLMRGLRQIFPDTRIDDDSSSNSMLIWTTPDRHQEIQAALDQISANLEKQNGGTMVIYQVKSQVVSPAQQIIQMAVPRARVMLGGNPPRIVAWAKPDEHAEIESIIKKVEKDAGSTEPRNIVIYDLEGVDATAVMQLIDPVLRAETQFITSSNGERLIVRAKTKHHAELKATIEGAKEKLPKVGKPTAHVYQLKHVDPNILMAIVRPISPASPMVPNVRDRSLVITATPEDHEKFQSEISKIDVERTDGESAYLKSHPIERADAGTVYGIVANLMSGQGGMQLYYDSRNNAVIANAHPDQHKTIAETIADVEKNFVEATPEMYRLHTADPNVVAAFLRTLVPRASITVDNPQRSLVIVATATDHQKMKEAIAKFDVEPDAENAAFLKSHQVKKADPGTTFGVVGQLLASHPEVRLSYDSRNGAIIAFADAAQQKKIEEVIADIEKDIEGATSEVYRFRTADPNAAIAILRMVAPRAQMTVDNRNRSIVVNAIEADHTAIAETIAKMDADGNDENGAVLRAYSIKSAEPGNLLNMLQTNFALQPDIRLSADYKNETIVALATDAQHKKIAAFIAEVDDKGKIRTAEVYRFRSADPTAASGILRTLIPKVQMAVDNASRSLVVTGTPEEHALIKSTIAKMEEEPAGGRGSVLRSYPVKAAEPNNLLNMLQTNFSLQPDIRLSLDSLNDTILAFARPEQHENIQHFIEEVEKGGQTRRAQVYRFSVADPNTALSVLSVLTPKAQMAVDQGSHSLVVTATEGDHEKIAATIKEMDREDTDGTGPQLRSYPVINAQVNTLAQAIQSAYRNRPDVQVTYDSQNNTVSAVAPVAVHVKIKEFIENSDKQGVTLIPKVYRFENADPQAALRVLRSLTPRADAAVDTENNSLVVSASEADHAKIQATVEAMDGDGAALGVPELKVYPLNAADGRSLQTTLRTLFRRDRDVDVSYDRENNSILALAPEKTQQRIADMVQEVERASSADPLSTLQLYRLENVDSRTAMEILENAFSQQIPKIKLSLDRRGRQIAAIARPEQHKMIQQTLKQMDTDERVLEVYQLDVIEPFTAELSIDRLFGSFDFDDPNAPVVDSDNATQQLFVRAKKEQQAEIRELLSKMGETGLAVQAESGKGGRMRVIPFQGDTAAAIREIERVWPQLRKNSIRVVTPSAVMPSLRRLAPDASRNGGTKPKPAKKNGAQFAVPAEEVPAQNKSAKPNTTKKQPTSQQQSKESATSQKSTTTPDVKSDAEPSSFPVIVAPGNGRITIASDDPEALDQFEALLRAMSPKRTGGRGNNFVVFSLRYTSAVQTATTLQQFFETGGRRGGSSRSRFSSNVTIVPDQRLNAIIVHGNRHDRDTIEELLQVLDAEDSPEMLSANRPRLILVKNTEASRIEDVIRSIYQSALKNGGGAPPIPVPAGVSQDVAVAIQRVNAASNAPLLTVEVDERTNSLVVMAPTSLFEEIKELVQQMDTAANDDSTRRLKVIKLKSLNIRSLENSLDMLTGEGSRSRSRRRRRGR